MKTHKRMIAMFVTLAFLSLLHATTMPLRADQAPSPSGTTVAADEQGPGFIEEEGYGSAPAKKSIIPVILIGLGVAVLAAVLVLVVFKTKYDILGTWDFNFTGISGLSSFKMNFSGTTKTGTWTITSFTDTGSYTVDAKKVQFQFSGTDWIWTGNFTGKDSMSGNHTWAAEGISGTWTATRAATTTETGKLPMSNRSVRELLK